VNEEEQVPKELASCLRRGKVGKEEEREVENQKDEGEDTR
jgi:hypothetical protein